MKHHPSTLNPTSRWFNLSVLLLKTKLKGIAMFPFVSVEKRYVSPNVCPYTKCRMVPLLSRGGFVTFVMVCNACVMGKDVVPINWGPELSETVFRLNYASSRDKLSSSIMFLFSSFWCLGTTAIENIKVQQRS